MKRLSITSMLAFSLCAFALPFTAGCGKRDYNVLLITVDTMRADRLGANGLTPNMDAVAKNGTLFEVARASVPLTLPSHTGIMTGVYPVTAGVRNNLFDKLGGDFATLAEVLKANGYQTGAVIGSYVLHSKFGLARGFDRYDDNIVEADVKETGGHPERKADEVAGLAATWIRGCDPKKRFFLWAHFYDPHTPYEPPSPYKEKFADAPYDGEIAFMDEKIGYLIEELKRQGVYEKTIIVIAGDHGESFGEHGEKGHGLMVYESTMRVPMTILVPKGKAGQRVKAPVELIDIMPTVLGYLKISPPSGLMGHDLSAYLVGKTPNSADDTRKIYHESRFAFDEYGWAFIQGMVVGKWKFIRAPKPELFDLSVDPGETNNLAASDEASAKKLDNQLTSFYKEIEPKPGVGTAADINERDRLILQSLNYASSRMHSNIPEDTSNLPDPKDMVEVSRAIQEAQRLLGQGRPGEIVALLEPFTYNDPNNSRLLMMIGQAASEAEDFAKAQIYYEMVLKLKPEDTLTLSALGMLLLKQHRVDEAEEVYARLDKLDPNDPARFKRRAEVLAARERFEESANAWQDYIKAFEQDAAAYVGLGLVLEKLEDYEGAIKAYRMATHYSPKMFRARLRLGILLYRNGSYADAFGNLAAALALRPDDPEANYYMALVYMDNTPQEPRKAFEGFKKTLELGPDRMVETECYANMARLAVAYGYPEAPDLVQAFVRSAMLADVPLEEVEKKLEELRALKERATPR